MSPSPSRGCRERPRGNWRHRRRQRGQGRGDDGRRRRGRGGFIGHWGRAGGGNDGGNVLTTRTVFGQMAPLAALPVC